MSELKQSYYNENLPALINKMKSMIEKNLDIISKEVECDVGSDKFHNVLKGRRMAAEDSVWAMKKIDSLEKVLNPDENSDFKSYYKEMLPSLLDELKIMVVLNMAVIDIDIEEEEMEDTVKKIIYDQILEVFGDKIARDLAKKMNTDSMSEDKYHLILKARKMAALDCEWALSKIDELETDSNATEEKVIKKSWSKRAAESN